MFERIAIPAVCVEVTFGGELKAEYWINAKEGGTTPSLIAPSPVGFFLASTDTCMYGVPIPFKFMYPELSLSMLPKKTTSTESLCGTRRAISCPSCESMLVVPFGEITTLALSKIPFVCP